MKIIIFFILDEIYGLSKFGLNRNNDRLEHDVDSV